MVMQTAKHLLCHFPGLSILYKNTRSQKMYFDEYEAEEGSEIYQAYSSGENETEICNILGIDMMSSIK
jgi:hypothetical protein